MRAFLQGVVVGVTATAVLAGGTVLAGTGVGGVFNLGQTNTVPAMTALSGRTPGKPQLIVTNTGTTTGSLAVRGISGATSPSIFGTNSGTGAGVQGTSTAGVGVVALSNSPTSPAQRVYANGGGPGVRIDTTGGAAPLVVNSTKRVTNLNADMLDGYGASDLGRVAFDASGHQSCDPGDPMKVVTVRMDVPTQGFVTLQGVVVLQNDSTSPVQAAVELWQGALPLSNSTATVPAKGSTTVPTLWVVDVIAGPGQWVDLVVTTPIKLGCHAALIGQFVPFGAKGSSTSLAAKPSAKQKAAERAGTATHAGQRRRR